MSARSATTTTAVALLIAIGACAARPSQALALNPLKPVCSVAGFVSGLAGKACSALQNGGRVINVGKRLLGGPGSAVKTAVGEVSSVASSATTALALAAIGTWVFGGAKFVLHETAHVLAASSAPRLDSPWFSSTYWRVGGIAAVLTLPFLFAAAVQAVVRSDLTLLARAAFGHLPLALLAVAIAAPLTMLLLAASDELSRIVSSAAGNQSAQFLNQASGLLGAVTGFSRSPFVAFFVALLTVAGAVVLWLELLMREAAVYVVVLMLPLVFAAFVWPARRVWAIRSVEVLFALILSKFAIVAVLSLGGAALSQSFGSDVAGMFAGVVLLSLAAFAPWAMLRLFPLAELGSGVAGSLRGELRPALGAVRWAGSWATEGDDWSLETAQMRNAANQVARDDPATAQKHGLDRGAGEVSALGRESTSTPVSQAAVAGAPGNGAAGEPTDDGRGSATGDGALAEPGADGPVPTATRGPKVPAGAASSSPNVAMGVGSSHPSPDGAPDARLELPRGLQGTNLSRVIAIDPAGGRIAVAPDDPRAIELEQSNESAAADIHDQAPPVQPPDEGHL